jgi:predicted metal-dependent enzyme (double-stranded beta helix superfamily)
MSAEGLTEFDSGVSGEQKSLEEIKELARNKINQTATVISKQELQRSDNTGKILGLDLLPDFLSVQTAENSILHIPIETIADIK